MELLTGESTVVRQSVEIKSARNAKELPFKNERQLEDWLFKQSKMISKAIGEEIRITGRQVETDFEYACDLVAESKKNFYPIELKIGQTNHSVVSQIQKYCFYFYRKLRYDRYKKVQGIVLANGFCPYSINELRQQGTRIFEVCNDQKSVIRLDEIRSMS